MKTEPINLNSLDKSDWPTFRFDQIAKSVSERVDPNNTDIELYYGLEHLDSESLHIKRNGTPADVGGQKLKCYPGDIIFGKRRAYQRKAALVENVAICSAHAMVLRANPDVIDPKLFPFFLHSDQFMHRAVDISVGSLSPTINWKTLREQEFLLPPKVQQAEIAELLWAIDEVVEEKGKCIDQIDTLIAASLKKQYLDNHENLTPLGEAGKWLSGGTPSKQNVLFWNGDIPWVSPKDMKVDFVETSIDKITQLAVDNGVSLLPEKSLMVVVRGMILAHSFPVALNMVPVAFNQDMRALLVSDDFVPEYLLYYLKFKKDKVLSMTTTTTHGTRRLASDELFCILVPKPSLEVQQDFIALIGSHTHALQMLVNSVETSKSLQKSLINQVF